MTENEEGSKEYNEHVKDDAGSSEAPKKSFKEKVKEKYSRVKEVVNKVVPHKDNTSKAATTKPTSRSKKYKKGRKSHAGIGRGGAKYTSVFGSRLDEGAVPGGDFIDPFEVEHEVKGNRGKSPFAISMGIPSLPDMGMGSLPSPGEMMGWGKSRKRRKR